MRRGSARWCAATTCSSPPRASSSWGGLLGLPAPAYAHVPLVLGPDGTRLAKRHGAVTLDDHDAGRAVRWMAATLGMPDAATAAEMREAFDPAALPRTPTRWAGLSRM